jgi:hypothetical protein
MMSNASPEIKFSHITGHPKSAPQKGDGEEKGIYGLSIPYIQQDEDYTKKKKIQNMAYYQELTRQIQEKNHKKLQETPEKFSDEKPISFEKPGYSRYLKKHEIENHTSLTKYNGQLFGGLLQRDEESIIKSKKMEQQREMQSFLINQMQEQKIRKDKQRLERLDLGSLESKKQDQLDFSQKSPSKQLQDFDLLKESSQLSDQLDQSFTKSKTLQCEDQDIESLKTIHQQLTQEKQDLSQKIELKATQIKEISEKTKVSNHVVQLTPSKFQKRTGRNDFSMKNCENPEPIASKSPVIIKPSQVSRNFKVKSCNEMSSLPKTPETELESVRMVKDVEQSRHNLDTAGKSCFIYPDSQGNFADEIDKFLVDFERKENQKYRNSYNHYSGQEKFSTSSIGFSQKKQEKPLMAYRAGFPSDFFKVFGKK